MFDWGGRGNARGGTPEWLSSRGTTMITADMGISINLGDQQKRKNALPSHFTEETLLQQTFNTSSQECALSPIHKLYSQNYNVHFLNIFIEEKHC